MTVNEKFKKLELRGQRTFSCKKGDWLCEWAICMLHEDMGRLVLSYVFCIVFHFLPVHCIIDWCVELYPHQENNNSHT